MTKINMNPTSSVFTTVSTSCCYSQRSSILAVAIRSLPTPSSRRSGHDLGALLCLLHKIIIPKVNLIHTITMVISRLRHLEGCLLPDQPTWARTLTIQSALWIVTTLIGIPKILLVLNLSQLRLGYRKLSNRIDTPRPHSTSRVLILKPERSMLRI